MARILALVVGVILWIAAGNTAWAVSVIRDDEIESYLKDITLPVFKAAGLHPENVRIYIVNDPELNAYVAGGMNIFVHTGLLTQSDDPNLLIGVLAHEAGHIEGGHLARMQGEQEKVGVGAALSYLLGIGAAAVGAPAAGQAIISGGTHIAERTLLTYSRGHEDAADQAALRILQKIGVSPKGLLDLLNTLDKEQRTLYGKVNPYTQTHPLSAERIATIRSRIAHEPELAKPTSPALKARHQRNRAKLKAFLNPPEETLKEWPETDVSFAARYARSIAYYRMPDLARSLAELDGLIKERTANPYLHELKGQVLFENGKVEEAVVSYRKAVKLAPHSPQTRLGLAVALLALEAPQAVRESIQHLEKVLAKEPRNAPGWRQLAIAYGRDGKLGWSYLALAEEAALLGNKEDVKKYAALVKQHQPENSPSALRAADILKTIEEK